MDTKPRHFDVVILGGGFAGKAAADTLCGRLAGSGGQRKERDVRILLVDRRNYQLFTPMLYQAATGLVNPGHIAESIRRDAADRGFEFVKGTVTAVNLAHKLVVTTAGDFTYDYLVIALGSVADDGRVPGAKGECIPLKTLEDSIAIHNRIVASFEAAANLSRTDPQRRRLLTFVVIGGSTGAELAGSLQDYLALLCDYYPSIGRSEPRVIVLERRDRLFPDGDESLSHVVKRTLEERGVELRLNVEVSRIDRSRIEMRDGSAIEAENLFWDAGTKPSAVLADLSETMVAKEKGRILVDEYLRIPVFDRVYVAGDDAAVRVGMAPKDGAKFVAPTAEAALEMGKYIGRRIAETISPRSGRRLGPFVFKEKGVMVSLGHRYGVARFKHITLKGLPGWIIWRAVHVALLSSQSGRFSVLVDWTLGSFRDRNVCEFGEPEVAHDP